MLRAAMETVFGASDAAGAWDWKTAYDACEAATVLFLRKFGPALRAKAASPAATLPMLTKIAGLLPTHTRRSEESQAFQQFSTRSEEHTSDLQSLMRLSYAVFCLKKTKHKATNAHKSQICIH